MLPWTHLSQQPKEHLNRFSHFCTVHGRVLLHMHMHILSPKNCTCTWGDMEIHLIHDSLGPPESKSQTASRSVQPFFAKLTAEWRTLPWKIAPSRGDLDPFLYMAPWAHSNHQPKSHLNQFSNFCTDDRRVSLYFTMGRPFPPSKLPLPMGDLDAYSTQMTSWSVQPILQSSLMSQTDRSRYSVGNNRPHLRMYSCDAT